MTISISRRLACLFVVLVGAPAIALADKADEATAHVAKATKAHKEGHFDEARVELEAAYALDPRPDLLYALGQVHAKLGNCRDAVGYYKRFVATQKDPQVVRVVEQAIAACQLPPEAAPEPPSPAPANAPAERPDSPSSAPGQLPSATRPAPFATSAGSVVAHPRQPWYKDKLGDGLALGGLVASVIGLVEYRSALSDLDAAEDRRSTTTLDRYNELVDSAHSKRTTSMVLVGAGGALIAAGVVRFVLLDGETETRGVGVAPARGGGVVTYGGRF